MVVLEAYQKALQGKKDRLWKVEHTQVIDSLDFDYFPYGIIPSIQPTHATSDMYWAAYSNFEENEKGSIEVGKFVDFTIYDKGIMTVPVKELPNINAELTFVDGVVR